MEAPLRRSDGVYRLHLLRASALCDAQGAITKWFGTCTDVHDQRALLAESIRMEAREQEMLQVALRADVSAALSKHDDLRTMLQGCCEALVRHLGVSFARVWTIEPAGDVLNLRASAGKYTHVDGGHAQVPVGAFEVELIAAERRPHLTNDVSTDERVGDREWARREGMVSFAGYPLIVSDRVVGVVAVFGERALDSDLLVHPPHPRRSLTDQAPALAPTARVGSVTVNVAPRPSPALCAFTVPPWSSTRYRAIARPSPRPPAMGPAGESA